MERLCWAVGPPTPDGHSTRVSLFARSSATSANGPPYLNNHAPPQPTPDDKYIYIYIYIYIYSFFEIGSLYPKNYAKFKNINIKIKKNRII